MKKSFLVLIILLIAVSCGTFFFREQKEEKKVYEISIGEEELSHIAEELLSERLPVDDVRIEVKADGKIYFRFTAEREEVLEYVKTEKNGILRGISPFLLPEEISGEAVFKVGFDDEEKRLHASLLEAELCGYKLPERFIPKTSREIALETINRALEEKGVTFQKVAFYDGGIKAEALGEKEKKLDFVRFLLYN